MTLINLQEWRTWLHEEQPLLTEQIERWLELIDISNESSLSDNRITLKYCGITLLLRSRTNDIYGNCFVIGTVDIQENQQGKGWLKAILKYCCEINPWIKLVIEDVENPKLLHFFKKHSFEVVSKRYNTSFIVDSRKLNCLQISSLQEMQTMRQGLIG